MSVKKVLSQFQVYSLLKMGKTSCTYKFTKYTSHHTPQTKKEHINQKKIRNVIKHKIRKKSCRVVKEKLGKIPT